MGKKSFSTDDSWARAWGLFPLHPCHPRQASLSDASLHRPPFPPDTQPAQSRPPEAGCGGLGTQFGPGSCLARVVITVPQITMAEPTDFYFAQLWSLESPRGRFWPIQCLVRAGFLAHRMLPCLCVLLWPLLGMCLCVYIYICAWGRVP